MQTEDGSRNNRICLKDANGVDAADCGRAAVDFIALLVPENPDLTYGGTVMSSHYHEYWGYIRMSAYAYTCGGALANLAYSKSDLTVDLHVYKHLKQMNITLKWHNTGIRKSCTTQIPTRENITQICYK